MLNKVATRIQSRLSRKGLKIVLGEIKDQCIKTFQNLENPTKVEINAVTDYLMNNATKLTVITEDIEAVSTNEAATELETLTNNNSGELEVKTSVYVGDEIGNIEPTSTEEVETLPQSKEDLINKIASEYSLSLHPYQIEELSKLESSSEIRAAITEILQSPKSSPHPAPLVTTTKNELINSTAQGLGIVLNTQEIEEIAENINSSSDDLTNTLEEIKGAIIAFIQYKTALNREKVAETLNEINQIATDSFSETSHQLDNGLRQINIGLMQQNRDFKSKVKAALTAFKVPSIKAG